MDNKEPNTPQYSEDSEQVRLTETRACSPAELLTFRQMMQDRNSANSPLGYRVPPIPA